MKIQVVDKTISTGDFVNVEKLDILQIQTYF